MDLSINFKQPQIIIQRLNHPMHESVNNNNRKMKRVLKEEFVDFINRYPYPLEKDVTGISDPPAISYNDFALADTWPESIVASTFAYDDDPEGYYYEPEDKRVYKILENYKEIYLAKKGVKCDS